MRTGPVPAPELDPLAQALAGGRLEVAERLARELIRGGAQSPALSCLLAEALRRQGRPDEALKEVEVLLEGEPDSAQGWLEAGRCLNNLGRLARANEALTKAAALAPEDAGIRHARGHVSQRIGDNEAARDDFAAAARLDPDWATPRLRLGLLEIEAGRFGDAHAALQAAVALAEDDPEAWTGLGVASHRLGLNDEAQTAYGRALALQPEHAQALANLGISLQDSGKLDAAIETYERALAVDPGDHRTAEHLANAWLEQGDCRQALAVADSLLARFPGHSGALASKLIALRRLGDEAGFAVLLDLERMVVSLDLETPAGFASMDEFNEALARHVLEHESLRYEPAGHATRKGHHTGDLLRYEKGPVAALEQAVARAVDTYLSALRDLAGHPVIASAPVHWRMSLWSVVMGSAGHQLPHIHPTAWLSGVYYARLPALISADDQQQAGWIEFGRPPPELAGDTDFPVRRAAPRAGRMFLFPAFLYHQTVPFESDENRISLAFDIAPGRGAGANIV